jgi:cobalt-zinc-cadmium efflux system membrane fusion protein
MKQRAAGLLIALVAWVCGASGAGDLIRIDEHQLEHLGIRVTAPQPTTSVPLARAPARVTVPPENEFVVSAPQAGIISKVNVAIGVGVKTGEVVAQINSPDLLGLQRALLNAKTELDLAQAKLRRDKTLLDEGVISRMRWQETKSDFDKFATYLKEAEQVLRTAGMSAQDIRELIRTRRLSGLLNVRSPINGVVLERMATAGQRVDILAPLFRIANLQELWLEIDMPQERMPEIRRGDHIVIENTELAARITHIGQNVTPNSQSVLVRAVIEGKAEQIRPGQNINVQLMHSSSDLLFKIPISALVRNEGKHYVFVKVPQGFEARRVEVAGEEERKAIIHEGLGSGEKIVVQGVAALKAAWLGLGQDAP